MADIYQITPLGPWEDQTWGTVVAKINQIIGLVNEQQTAVVNIGGFLKAVQDAEVIAGEGRYVTRPTDIVPIGEGDWQLEGLVDHVGEDVE